MPRKRLSWKDNIHYHVEGRKFAYCGSPSKVKTKYPKLVTCEICKLEIEKKCQKK